MAENTVVPRIVRFYSIRSANGLAPCRLPAERLLMPA